MKDGLDKEVSRRGTKDHCQVKGVGCMGLCSEGPLVSTSGGVLYKKVEAGDSSAILDSLGGNPSPGSFARRTFRSSSGSKRLSSRIPASSIPTALRTTSLRTATPR